MNHVLGMIIESLVAALLMLTIGYCMLLNTRLKRLKADEQSLRATIAELITATEIAERAIGGLKVTVRDCNENLGNRLQSATELAMGLDKRLLAGEALLRRLSRIVAASKPLGEQVDGTPAPAPTPVPASTVTPAQAIVAAAQAFSERKRTTGLAA